MDLNRCVQQASAILMEGALGERLKREYHLQTDGPVAMASLIYTSAGRTALRQLWLEYHSIAKARQLPFLATTPTRRANRERVEAAGYSAAIIQDNVEWLRETGEAAGSKFYVGGLMGCKGDAYTGEGALDTQQAHTFHAWQAEQFCRAGTDFLLAGILPTLREAKGMALAMSGTGLPYILSFTIQRNGCLVDGHAIRDAIMEIDDCTQRPPVLYMTNCVHPDIAYAALAQPFNQGSVVRTRFLGIQANTSPLPYAQLDRAKDLQTSPPEAWAEGMMRLRQAFGLKVFGGCCGTDGRHIASIAARLPLGEA